MFLLFQVFAFAHHAWARESKRGVETGNGNGSIENGSSVSSSSGGDEGYGDDQVTIMDGWDNNSVGVLNSY